METSSGVRGVQEQPSKVVTLGGSEAISLRTTIISLAHRAESKLVVSVDV